MKRYRSRIATVSVMAILSNGCLSTGSSARVAPTRHINERGHEYS